MLASNSVMQLSSLPFHQACQHPTHCCCQVACKGPHCTQLHLHDICLQFTDL
jgi:hypothetical protein